MSIVLVGSTSGSITLQEPAVSGSTVLSLPAVTGTILTTTSPKAGNVIQVVSGVRSATTSTTSLSFVTTNLTASITPSSSSNKILIIVGLGDCSASNTPTNGGITVQLQRNGSAVGANFYNQLSYQDPVSYSIVGGAFTYLDSPASTSSLAYTVFFKSQGSTVECFRDGSQGSIILMEIAA